MDACFLAVFIEPKTTSQEEAKAFKKYAAMMRFSLRNNSAGFRELLECVSVLFGFSCFFQLSFMMERTKLQGEYPFEMHSAAQELENISNGVVSHEPLMDVSWSDS